MILKKVLSRSFLYRFSTESSCSHTIELNDEYYLHTLKEEYQNLYNNRTLKKIVGFASKNGTLKYKNRKPDLIPASNFRIPYKTDLNLSSIGVGTYVGSPDEEDDLKMFNALIDSVLSGGINVLDTAINYRYMRSERVLGAALNYLINEKKYEREELFISSKIGYLPEDSDSGIGSSSMIKNLIEKGKIKQDDVVGACHCMHPEFLKDQLDRSLDNIGLETLDLLYLHNPAESQLALCGEEKFFDRLGKAFEYFEKERQIGRIKNYGIASWICFRAKSEEVGIYLNLEKVVDFVEKICGKDNGFKFIQVPINILMPEAFAEIWQEINIKEGNIEKVRLLTAARMKQINVISSSSLLQGTLMQLPLPTDIFKCHNLGAKHLQFVRSVPAESLISSLVGHKKNRHVKMNIEVLQHEPLTAEEFWNFLIPPNPRKMVPDEPYG